MSDANAASGSGGEDPLYRDPELADFYDIENGWSAAEDFCVALAADARSVLDLGCGTGRLAAALAEGRYVVGVDPAAAMLDVARNRPGGGAVEWVEADARAVRLAGRFDLILLTGHAFQVFLTEEDRRAALRTIALHLAPEGRFIFDTRNPATEEWREWTPDRSMREIEHPMLGRVRAWNDVSYDPAASVATYETHYRAVSGGSPLAASSRIAFVDRDHLASLLMEAGLRVDRWMGDWTGQPCRADSPEIIPVGRLA